MSQSLRGIGNGIGLIFLTLSLGSTGCASRSREAIQFHRLVIDNASDDVIRVSIDLGDREIRLGQVEPMTSGVLRIRPGLLPPSAPNARILIVPVGTPAAVQEVSNSAAVAIPSDSYRLGDLIQHAWRFSGSRIQPLGPVR